MTGYLGERSDEIKKMLNTHNIKCMKSPLTDVNTSFLFFFILLVDL